MPEKITGGENIEANTFFICNVGDNDDDFNGIGARQKDSVRADRRPPVQFISGGASG